MAKNKNNKNNTNDKYITSKESLTLSPETLEEIKRFTAAKVEREFLYPYSSPFFNYFETHPLNNKEYTECLDYENWCMMADGEDSIPGRGYVLRSKKEFFIATVEIVAYNHYLNYKNRHSTISIGEAFNSLDISLNKPYFVFNMFDMDSQEFVWSMFRLFYGEDIASLVDWWIFRADLIRNDAYSTIWLSPKNNPFKIKQFVLRTSFDLWDFINEAFDLNTCYYKEDYNVTTSSGENFEEFMEREKKSDVIDSKDFLADLVERSSGYSSEYPTDVGEITEVELVNPKDLSQAGIIRISEKDVETGVAKDKILDFFHITEDSDDYERAIAYAEDLIEKIVDRFGRDNYDDEIDGKYYDPDLLDSIAEYHPEMTLDPDDTDDDEEEEE